MKDFYIVKNRNYTTLCTIVLRDKNLSLKAKGLYAFIASLPNEWDYTVNGLIAVLKEGRDAILTAIWELESAGYLKRGRIRNANGQMGKAFYILFEQPNGDTVTNVGKSDVGKAQPKNINFVNKENEKRKSKKKLLTVGTDPSQHFENERTYTKEELDALIDDIDDINF